MPKISRNRLIADPMLIKDAVNVAIAVARIDRHIAASKMQMPIRTFNSKLVTGYWTFEELYTLFSVLKVPDESILQIFGRKR